MGDYASQTRLAGLTVKLSYPLAPAALQSNVAQGPGVSWLLAAPVMCRETVRPRLQVAFESNLRALQTRQHGEEQHHIAAHAEMQQRQPIMAPPSSYPAGPGLEPYSQSSSDAHPINALPPGSGLGTQAFIPLPNGSLASSGKLR